MKIQNQNPIRKVKPSVVKIVSTILILITVAACSHSADKSEAPENMTNTTIQDSIIKPIAGGTPLSKINHQWLRTAELKFKTLDLIKSTQDIETITQRFNGIVLDTKLNTEINYTEQTEISKDSSIIKTHYTRTNTMLLRVPNTKLDSVLQLISKTIYFLDHRTIKCEDVSAQTLANTLTQLRLSKTETRLQSAINNKSAKLPDVIAAEAERNAQAEQKDAATINQYNLNDKIEWSTIALQIYERQNINTERIENEKNIIPYSPSLIQEFGSAISTGWYVLIRSLIYLLNIWPLLLAIIATYLIYKRHKKIAR